MKKHPTPEEMFAETFNNTPAPIIAETLLVMLQQYEPGLDMDSIYIKAASKLMAVEAFRSTESTT